MRNKEEWSYGCDGSLLHEYHMKETGMKLTIQVSDAISLIRLDEKKKRIDTSIHKDT